MARRDSTWERNIAEAFMALEPLDADSQFIIVRALTHCEPAVVNTKAFNAWVTSPIGRDLSNRLFGVIKKFWYVTLEGKIAGTPQHGMMTLCVEAADQAEAEKLAIDQANESGEATEVKVLFTRTDG
jgi:hypothetical protein